MIESYTAADQVPMKLVLNTDLANQIAVQKRVPPVHIQLNLTNKCNLNCPFCSCANVKRDEEMDFDKFETMVKKMSTLGTESVTITGGGEPLMYLHFDEAIELLDSYGIKIGLVTNGTLMDKQNLSKLVWCRISDGDQKERLDFDMVKRVIKNTPIDWAFSYVVSKTPDLERIKELVGLSDLVTHIRLVADLFIAEQIDLNPIEEYLKAEGVDDSKVIYQSRNQPTKGSDCYICYLKPVIDVDFKVYTCCGAQYALKTPTKDMPKALCIGNALEFDKIYERSNKPFDGKICVKCYYSSYNKILNSMLGDIRHREFV